ncbi:transposase [Streptomyces sp. I05A-00742]|uniref:transposase n=1 Tax=Streptomyces sp. I05A-00742 TaxID=2732853 RepID=UPI00289DB758|nr:transposase [Streptomyces sp. I05A-00742]
MDHDPPFCNPPKQLFRISIQGTLRLPGASSSTELLAVCPGLATARDLAYESSSAAIARERRGHDLTHWMALPLDQGPQPVQGFAAFLQDEWAAVVNSLTLNWSSGVVEGQVTPHELIKRRSYGRASFGLLTTLALAQSP